jgi:hypothetical protein
MGGKLVTCANVVRVVRSVPSSPSLLSYRGRSRARLQSLFLFWFCSGRVLEGEGDTRDMLPGIGIEFTPEAFLTANAPSSRVGVSR